MKKLSKIFVIMAMICFMATVAAAQEKSDFKRIDDLEIDVWANKGEGATYYYGEDVAIYFQAANDCYVVVYDIDPTGDVSLLFPSDYDGDCFVQGGEVYRIPDAYDDYRLEVTGPKGREYIYAVASYNRIDPPDFIRYEFFEYGDWDNYYDDFIHSMRGERAAFVADLNDRIVRGPYVSASTMFYVDDYYRHHRWYRYWHYDPYYISSVWIGCNFVGAEVWIDGCYYGIAPILIPEIYIGRHWIWIYYHGYPCWQDYVYIRYGQRYYVDAKIKRRYRDFDYGRRGLRDWKFKQEKYRNEPDFIKKAKKYRTEHSQPRPRPPVRIQEKYSRKVYSDNRYSDRADWQKKYGGDRSGFESGITPRDKKIKANKNIDSQGKIKNPLSRDNRNIILKKETKKQDPKRGTTKEPQIKKSGRTKTSDRVKSNPVRKSGTVEGKDRSSRSGSKAPTKKGRK